MTIENMQRFVNSIWDWGILDGCFGCSGIAASDLDGIVERKGRFLVIESKGRCTTVKEGQQRLLKALQALGKFTIVIVWGNVNEPNEAQLYTEEGKRSCKFACDLERLRFIVERWYKAANEGASPQWRWTRKDEENDE